MEREQFREPDGKPTGRQIYALAAALCERVGERFPSTRIEASTLIDRLRANEGGGSSERKEDTMR